MDMADETDQGPITPILSHWPENLEGCDGVRGAEGWEILGSWCWTSRSSCAILNASSTWANKIFHHSRHSHTHTSPFRCIISYTFLHEKKRARGKWGWFFVWQRLCYVRRSLSFSVYICLSSFTRILNIIWLLGLVFVSVFIRFAILRIKCNHVMYLLTCETSPTPPPLECGNAAIVECRCPLRTRFIWCKSGRCWYASDI